MIKGAECKCQKKVVPYRNICPRCGKSMAMAEFEEKGTVLSQTTLHAVPEGFEGPIKLAMIQVQGGANLICRYEGERDLRIGEKVSIKSMDELYYCEPIT